MTTVYLYLLSALIACLITAGSLPFLHRFLATFFLDKPNHLKKHQRAVPVLGGCAVLLGLSASLIFIRLTTDFPTGTLHSLRGILLGTGVIFFLGLADDIQKPKGICVSIKLLGQALATAILMYYGVRITLFDSAALCYLITFFWVVGLTNAFNLLDIQDGLCVSQAMICALGLALIALPSEVIYINFAAWAMLGACAAFWPYNHAVRLKTFLGDSGSMMLGFLLAALSCGMGYSEHSSLGFLTPLFILAVPLFDTAFVAVIRALQGKNPFKGSPDHAALRLRQKGFSPTHVLVLFSLLGIAFNFLAFIVSKSATLTISCISGFSVFLFLIISLFLAKIKVHS